MRGQCLVLHMRVKVPAGQSATLTLERQGTVQLGAGVAASFDTRYLVRNAATSTSLRFVGPVVRPFALKDVLRYGEDCSGGTCAIRTEVTLGIVGPASATGRLALERIEGALTTTACPG